LVYSFFAQPADVNNDPEYIEVYSLPVGLAGFFHNCSYLEYPAIGKLPDPPRNGYVSSGADIGDLCCPCLFPDRSPASDDADEEIVQAA
jgi:hypothetical protein